MKPLAGDDPVEIAGYQLRAQLGSGGMGRVYLAFTPAGRPVALKVVRPDLGGDAGFRQRFRQEVDASRRVHGMYTAQVLDADPDASPPWLATAYVPGPSLHQAVDELGPMPEQTVFVLLAGVAEALAAIHAAGIVHRDLKPSNVLLAPDGPRVIDFGIARAADSTMLTGTGMIIGSPPFMAPEQVKGHEITRAVDVFALGAVAMFAATGRAPFGDGIDMGVLYRVVHAEPDLSACPLRLREVVGRCLAKEPAARPSPAEVVAACQQAQAAGRTDGIAPPWLPPDVLAALAQHVPPSAPLSPQALYSPQAPLSPQAAFAPQAPYSPQAAFASPAVPSQGFQMSQVPQTPPMTQAAYAQQAPWASATMAGATPLGPPTVGAVVPPQGGATTYPGRAARSRPMILGGVLGAVGVAAVAVVGMLALGAHGRNPVPPGPPAAAPSLAAHSFAATSPASQQSAAVPPPARAKPSYAVDPCLVGTWNDAGDVLNNTIDGQPTPFTGKGGSMVVNADGSVTQQFGPETLTGTSNGNVWTEVLGGSGTMHASTRHGNLVMSNVAVSPDAIYTLYENGVFQSSGPTSVSTNPNRYTCSPSTLKMHWNNGTSVYNRAS